MRAPLYSVAAAVLVTGAALVAWRASALSPPPPPVVRLQELLDDQHEAARRRAERQRQETDFERSLPSRVSLLRRELAEPGFRVSRVASTGTGDRVFYITGEVRRQGSYRFADGLTFGRAIETAGGFTDRGDKTRINVVRVVDGKTKRLAVKLEDRLLPDDVIQVARRLHR